MSKPSFWDWWAAVNRATVHHPAQYECENAWNACAAEYESRLSAGTMSDGFHTLNELYEHRHALFSVLCCSFGGWKAKVHEDGTMFDGWFIAGVSTPKGICTYHLPLVWWDRFRCQELERAPKWDGHTANDVIGRIQSLSAAAIRAEVEAEMIAKACAAMCWMCRQEPTIKANQSGSFLHFDGSSCPAGAIRRLTTDPHYRERRELEARISAYKAINEIIKSCGEVDRDGEYIFREDDFLELFDNEQHGAELELADLPKVEVKS